MAEKGLHSSMARVGAVGGDLMPPRESVIDRSMAGVEVTVHVRRR